MSSAPPVTRPAPAPSWARRSPRGPEIAVWAMTAVWAAVLAYLSVARQRAYWTGRFDVGNMVQAVWSTAHGRPLETTSVSGEQFSRLGAHVDPILAVFAPLTWTGHLPEALLIAQAVIVALGALPAFWLGRRWLGDDRLAVAAAAVYLLYPPTQWATVTEFHPVTLAAPLLMYCIWAAEERRYLLLTVFATLAALTKEEVGLALAMLGLWMVVRGAGRRYGAFLAGASLAWTAFAVMVVIPRYNDGRGSEFVSRYGSLGSDGHGVALTLLTRPWEAVQLVSSYDRLSYLAALLLPLLLLPLAAPLLLLGALPEVLINILADWFPQYSIQFQYVAVIVPFAVGAAILGLARLRRATRPAFLVRLLADARAVAAVWVGAVAISGVYLGPLPWWSAVPVVGSSARTEQYRVTDHSRAMARGVALIPDGVPVSAGNLLGAHLSERDAHLHLPGDPRRAVGDRGHPPPVRRRSPAAARAPPLPAATPGPAGHAAGVRRGRGARVPPHPLAGAGVIPRIAGGVLLTLGVAVAALPGLTWFTAPPDAERAHASGFAGAGELWLLPALGILIALAGAGLVASRPGAGRTVARWAGPLALGAGLLALVFAAWAGVDPALTLTVTLPGATEAVPADVALAPAAVATPVVAAIVVALGAGATWAGWRR